MYLEVMSKLINAAFFADFSEIEPVDCPCGSAKRALSDCSIFPGTIHETQFNGESKTHYHKRMTETYYVLNSEPDSMLEIDGKCIPIHPGMCIVIPPGVKHRGIGKFKIINIVIPKFDPTDEWFD